MEEAKRAGHRKVMVAHQTMHSLAKQKAPTFASAPLRSLFLGRKRSTRALCARAPCRAGSGWSMHNKGHCTGERPLSFGARKCDMPATAFKNQPAFAWYARARYCARCLSGGSAARELSARARHAALVVIGLCIMR